MLLGLDSSSVMAEPEQTIVTLFNQLAKYTQPDVHYREEKHIQLLDMDMIQTGVLQYRRPDTLIREQQTPDPQRFEIDANNLVIIKGNKKRKIPLDKAPALRAMAESFRATLSGDLPRLQKYFDLQFSGTPARWKLSLQPRDPGLLNYISLISIAGEGVQIKRYELYEREGDWSVMTLTPTGSDLNPPQN